MTSTCFWSEDNTDRELSITAKLCKSSTDMSDGIIGGNFKGKGCHFSCWSNSGGMVATMRGIYAPSLPLTKYNPSSQHNPDYVMQLTPHVISTFT